MTNSRFVDHSLGWANSPEEKLADEVGDTIWSILDKASINARKRKIIWPDGQKLTINQSVKRIHAENQGYPLELIESHLIGWLEQVVVSPYDSELQLAELNRLTAKWIEAHESQAQAVRETDETRYS